MEIPVRRKNTPVEILRVRQLDKPAFQSKASMFRYILDLMQWNRGIDLYMAMIVVEAVGTRWFLLTMLRDNCCIHEINIFSINSKYLYYCPVHNQGWIGRRIKIEVTQSGIVITPKDA